MEPYVLETFPAHRSKTGGFSPARLARMHDALLRHVESGRLPGLVALLSRRGVEHVDAIGTLAFDRTAPMRRDTIFRLASVTKPITAVAAMILVEECRLRLDDPVDDLLPELANRTVLRTIDSELDDTVPATRPITVRDLLTFRSGYGEVVFLSPTCPLQRALIDARLPLSAWNFPGTPDEFMQCIGRLPLAHQPGERWLYHMSAEILGVLIARASGMSLSAFMRQRIFEPLGMKDTRFYPADGSPRIATLYQRADGGLRKQPNPGFMNGAYFSGGGGLLSTAEDYLQFAQMLLNGGQLEGRRLVSAPGVDLMASVFAPDTLPGRLAGEGYGLSVRVVSDPAARNTFLSKGSFGWSGAYNTHFFIDRGRRTVGTGRVRNRSRKRARRQRGGMETSHCPGHRPVSRRSGRCPGRRVYHRAAR